MPDADSYSVDYGHSLYFAGIGSLQLADGTFLTDFTATGEDGMDYKRSYVPTSTVPDTADTFGVLGGSLLALTTFRRRVA